MQAGNLSCRGWHPDIWPSSIATRRKLCGESSSLSTAPPLEVRCRSPNKLMKVTEKDVVYVADLANVELTDQERVGMVRDLNSILGYMDRLNELDTSNTPPMAQVSDRYGVDEAKQGSERFAYASREDVLEGLRKSLPHNVALENAPDADDDFFRVPKVIER
jgi:aspartyl-tRNA(Asn)/glutamyl-tRNA(Gln) amidotransferase subunit C